MQQFGSSRGARVPPCVHITKTFQPRIVSRISSDRRPPILPADSICGRDTSARSFDWRQDQLGLRLMRTPRLPGVRRLMGSSDFCPTGQSMKSSPEAPTTRGVRLSHLNQAFGMRGAKPVIASSRRLRSTSPIGVAGKRFQPESNERMVARWASQACGTPGKRPTVPG